jgi:hypothetical protein
VAKLMDIDDEEKEGATSDAAKSGEDVAASLAKIQAWLAAGSPDLALPERTELSRLLTLAKAAEKTGQLRVVDEEILATTAVLQKQKKEADQAQKNLEEAVIFAKNAMLNCKEWLKKCDRVQARVVYRHAVKYVKETEVDKTELLAAVEETDTRASWAATAGEELCGSS